VAHVSCAPCSACHTTAAIATTSRRITPAQPRGAPPGDDSAPPLPPPHSWPPRSSASTALVATSFAVAAPDSSATSGASSECTCRHSCCGSEGASVLRAGIANRRIGTREPHTGAAMLLGTAWRSEASSAPPAFASLKPQRTSGGLCLYRCATQCTLAKLRLLQTSGLHSEAP
jgi:hypothetical protein